MLKRYAIWDKETPFKTPCGKTLSAVEVIQKYFGNMPICDISKLVIVCAAGDINGACIASLDWMIEGYESIGCDFTSCVTAEEKLYQIEKFEDNLINTGRVHHRGKYFIGIEPVESNNTEKYNKKDLYTFTKNGHMFWSWDYESIKKFS